MSDTYDTNDSGAIRGGYQPGGIGLKVVFHGGDAADLGANQPWTELGGDPVMNAPLTQREDLNIGRAGLPNLTFSQGISAGRLHACK